MRRDAVTWAGYLSLALFTFFLNIQGNILPFLRDQFSLSYRVASLHPAALAIGLILCGALAERPMAWLGRKYTLGLGLAGLVVGALMIVVAPSPAISIGGCLVMGLLGGLVLATVPAMLVQWQGEFSSTVLGEANGMSYAASLIAALSTGIMLSLHFGWQSGLILGIGLTVVLILGFRNRPLPEPPARDAAASGRLPLAYWLHWMALVGFVGLEQATLVWAPEFLETVKGLTRSSAATGAGAFSAGMLIVRMSSALLLGKARPLTVLQGSLILTLPAFALYWGAPTPLFALAGLFLLGLGTALLYPLTLAFAINLSAPNGDTASARASLASGVAVLTAPMLVGTLADGFGLRTALVVLPVLGVLSLLCLKLGRALDRTAGDGSTRPVEPSAS